MNTEEQQRLWDLMLVQAWTAFSKMNNLCDQFIRQTQIEVGGGHAVDALAHLKRVPRRHLDTKKPVRAFVAERLPSLSAPLWDGRTPAKDLIQQLYDSGIDSSAEEYKTRPETRRRQAGRKKMLGEALGAVLMGDYKKKFTRMYGGTKMTASNKHRHNKGPK